MICINFISASCVKLNKIQFCNICLKKEKYSVDISFLVFRVGEIAIYLLNVLNSDFHKVTFLQTRGMNVRKNWVINGF